LSYKIKNMKKIFISLIAALVSLASCQKFNNNIYTVKSLANGATVFASTSETFKIADTVYLSAACGELIVSSESNGGYSETKGVIK